LAQSVVSADDIVSNLSDRTETKTNKEAVFQSGDVAPGLVHCDTTADDYDDGIHAFAADGSGESWTPFQLSEGLISHVQNGIQGGTGLYL
jgi:hypothetical protein